jgi:hypothetical protein
MPGRAKSSPRCASGGEARPVPTRANMKTMSKRTLKRQKTRKSSIATPDGLAGANTNGMMTAPAWVIIGGSALLSMIPLFVCWRQLSKLFFFHDDFLLLHELAGSTLFRWIVHPFVGESIVPLFKFLWISAVWSFGGSYMAMIVLQWVTHLSICLAFGWLLIRLRVPPVAAGFAVLTFGLPWSNIETLAWSMQWGAQLTMLFFVLAWHALLTILARRTGVGVYDLRGELLGIVRCWRIVGSVKNRRALAHRTLRSSPTRKLIFQPEPTIQEPRRGLDNLRGILTTGHHGTPCAGRQQHSRQQRHPPLIELLREGAAAMPVRSSISGSPGKRLAVWASGPMPRCTMSNRGISPRAGRRIRGSRGIAPPRPGAPSPPRCDARCRRGMFAGRSNCRSRACNCWPNRWAARSARPRRTGARDPMSKGVAAIF